MAEEASFCHVFLSFRGETRNKFTCFLYEALKAEGFIAFMDKSDIRVGDEVDLTIKQGIRNSMSAIIIFSQNYAYSTWCLDELVLILERKKNSRYFIIPIFYEVEIGDIKHQLGNYGLALEKHRARHSDKVEKWREALVEVGNILGDHVEGLQSTFIQNTVKLFRERLAAKFPECRLPMPKSSVLEGSSSSSTSLSRQEPSTPKEEIYSRMDIVFDDLIGEVNRLLLYPWWLPVQIRQISFYSEKLMFLSMEFQSFTITSADYVSALTEITLPLHVLVNKILESKYRNTGKKVNLSPVGVRLGFDVALICKTFFDKEESQDLASHFHFVDKKSPMRNFRLAILLEEKFPMSILFGDLIGEVNRLLIYPGWLPIQIRQISFYSEKLMFLSKEFQSSTNADCVYELHDITGQLNFLVSDILETVYKSRGFEVYLDRVGDQLAFDVALIYNTYFAKEESQDFFASHFYFDDNNKFQIALLLGQAKFKMDILFDHFRRELNILLTYPHWLPIETCQITFYSEKLKSFSKAFGRFAATDSDYVPDLTDLTRAINLFDLLDYLSANVESLNLNDPPDLTRVGDQLASKLALVYKTFFGKAKECDSPDFASQFYFDKNKFQDHEGEVFVGFQLEASNLLQQLASITKKQLEVISIVGMAGLGKTTLARRLYNDPYVVSYFHVRAWVTCSQLYQKRDLLLTILRSVLEITDEVCSMKDNTLAHHLYRALKGRRYLIVIDDIWSSQAWDDFKTSFPDDNNGSKIMLTTRLKDVALHAQPKGNPLSLRFLTEDESFALFRMKACLTSSFFTDLCLIGKSITRKCRGLPLAIVVIAGLLKNNFGKDWWTQVAESVSSYIVTDENQYMDTLALSYNHLPQHLRPCFLYFGAFPEDQEIPLRKLIRLWIAEGFICQDGTKKSLEDVAEDYLMDLMSRSLVVVGDKGFDGAIKTCRVHDLLHDLCLRKAKEENFSPKTYMCIQHFYCCADCSVSDASLANPPANTQLFLSTNVLNIPSRCSCASSEVSQTIFKDVAMIWDTSNLITALDISSIELYAFPSELLQLVNLRYLQLRFRHGDLPESISHLIELQTLVVSSRMDMVVPENLWKMVHLKHLCIKSGENRVNLTNLEEPSLLENLQTMSLVSPTRPCQHILARTPNLQKLGLCGPLTTKSGDFKCPDLSLLMHLKTLKLLNTIHLCKPGRLSTSIIFPEGLKSLTMSNTCADWTEAWIFEMIPNLEVLKLKFHAFVGKEWETSPEAFPRLKFLKLDELDIVTWTASRYDFPVLQRLQVYRCPYLMEIPEDFGNICTLEWIELSGCSVAATNSARDIQKEQESNGNDWLKFLLNPGPTPS